MNSLNIHIIKQNGYIRVRLEGSADMTAAQEMRKQFETLIRESQPILVVDMKGLDFICSMGLGCLIFTHHRCRENKGRLILINPQQAIHTLMKTTQLDEFFTICADDRQAEKLLTEILGEPND